MTTSEPARRPGRPATGVTPVRKIRAGRIWDEAAELALANGETMTALVLRAIEAEVRRLRRQAKQAEENSKES